MIVAGLYKGVLFIIDGSGYRGGLDRATVLNEAEFYLDNKIVIPLLVPGIVRTAKADDIKFAGQGFDPSIDYRFNGCLTLEITADGEIYNYDSFASSNEKFATENRVMGRYCGKLDNKSTMFFTSSPKGLAYVINAMNLTKLRKDIEPTKLFDIIARQMDSDRYVGSYKTLYTIKHDVLLESLKRVNANESTAMEEAHEHWFKFDINNCNSVKRISLSDLSEFNYSNAALWEHYIS